jgi:putative membrane protein
MWNNGAGCLGGGFPMMMFGGIFMLIFWGLVIWLIVLAIRKLSSGDKSSQTDNAVEVLRQRYPEEKSIQRNTDNDYMS